MAYYYNGKWNVNPEGAATGGASGLLPLQSEGTTKTRTVMPTGYNTLRDYIAAGIPKLSAGADTRAKLSELNADPLKSTLFKNTITPMLAAMVPSETAARRSLTDRFRQAGQSQSGAFAEQARLQESDILGKRNEVVATHASDIYGKLLASLGLNLQGEQLAGQPYQLGNTLLGNLRNEGTDVTTSGYAPTPYLGSYGGEGGRGGGRSGGGDDFGFSAESRGVMEAGKYGYERGQITPPWDRPSAQNIPPAQIPYYPPPKTSGSDFTGFGNQYADVGWSGYGE